VIRTEKQPWKKATQAVGPEVSADIRYANASQSYDCMPTDEGKFPRKIAPLKKHKQSKQAAKKFPLQEKPERKRESQICIVVMK